MNKEQFTTTSQINSRDIVTAILSNLTVVIQVVALGIVGLSNVLRISNLFLFKDLVDVANFTILFLSFSLIGIYSFFKTNPEFPFTQPDKKGVLRQINEKLFGTKIPNPLSKQGEKKLILTLFIITFLSSIIFFYSTFRIKFFPEETWILFYGFTQIMSYSLSLICGSVVIFIWIRDQLDKKNQFTEDSFISNLRNTLIEYEIVETPEIKVQQNFSISNGNHLIKIKLGQDQIFLITNFDGKRIFGEITETEYNNIMNPPQVQNAKQQ